MIIFDLLFYIFNLLFIFLNYVNSIILYLESLIRSEGILSSIQFSFTALFTLLIPLFIFGLEQRRELKDNIGFKYLDEYIVNENLDFKKTTCVIIITSFCVLLWDNQLKNEKFPVLGFYIIILMILVGCFAWFVNRIFKIVDFYGKSIDEYRAEYIRKSKASSDTEFKWFKEFVTSGTQKEGFQINNEIKVLGETSEIVFAMFTDRVNKLINTKDYELIKDFISVLIENFDQIEENFVQTYFIRSGLLNNILDLHYACWVEENTGDKPYKEEAYYLLNKLIVLINQIQKYSLKNRDNADDYISQIQKHIDKFGLEELKGGITKGFYFEALHIEKVFFENLKFAVDKSYYFFSSVPSEWKTTNNIDLEKMLWKENSLIAKHWFNELKEWIFGQIRINIETKSDDIVATIKTNLQIFMPNINLIYVSSIFWYLFCIENNVRDRVDYILKNSRGFGFTDDFQYSDNESQENFNSIAEYTNDFENKMSRFSQTRDSNTIKILTILLNDKFKYLNYDLDKLNSLKTDDLDELQKSRYLELLELLNLVNDELKLHKSPPPSTSLKPPPREDS